MNGFAVRKLKYVAELQNTKILFDAVAESQPYIGLENIESWTGKLVTGKEPEPEGMVALFQKGDVLFGKLRPYLAKAYLAEDQGTCSTEAFVLRAKPEYSAAFLRYILLDKKFIDEVDASTFGAKMPRASWDFVGSRQIPFPEIAVQNTVVAYLDRELSRVDRTISKKTRQVRVLKEREEATYLTAITGAHLPDERQDSGVEWIGDIPAHWEAPKFTHVARQESGHTPSRTDDGYWIVEECVIPWLSLADVWQIRDGARVYVSVTSENISQIGIDNSAARLLPADTVVLSRTASVGFPAILSIPMATTQDFVGWICGRRVRPKFLYYVLRAMKPEFRRLMIGSTHQTIYMPDIRSFRLPLPPLAEQDEVIRALDKLTGRFREAAGKITASLEKLKEHRATLITAAVCGQINIAEEMLASTPGIAKERLRVLIGAEIVHSHQGHARFGRVKLQKLLYLAEVHAAISELGGNYLRQAAGPLDRVLIEATERGMETAGFFRAEASAAEGGVRYTPLAQAGQHRAELSQALGARTSGLREMISALRDFDTRNVEAVATLYAVWNDALLDGETPNDDAVISAFLEEWRTEKREKFKDADLRHWLAWMKRNGMVPRGIGPRTISTMPRSLFS